METLTSPSRQNAASAVKIVYINPALNKRLQFSSLYNQYSGALNTMAAKMVKNQTVAEDILQDVFVKVWKNMDKYDAEKGTLFTWMLNILRNTCIDYFRSSECKIKLITTPDELIPGNPAIASMLYYNAEKSDLRNLIFKLDTKYRHIIDLVYFWGYSQEEVSQMLAIPVGTVKTRSRAGLQHLRNLYQAAN